MTTDIPVVEWDDFTGKFRWRQGQHLVVVKPTGGGKTTLLGALLHARPPAPHIAVFVNKVHDATFARQFPARDGWYRIEEWPPPRHKNKILLWPRFKPGMPIPAIVARQRAVFTYAMDSIFSELGWTVVFEEENYLSEFLGLQQRVAMFHYQGRSSGLTCVDGIQRPVNVPKGTFSGAHHAFIAHTSDREDMRKLADLGTRWAPLIKDVAPTLDEFEFLYVPARVKGKHPVRTTVNIAA